MIFWTLLIGIGVAIFAGIQEVFGEEAGQAALDALEFFGENVSRTAGDFLIGLMPAFADFLGKIFGWTQVN